MQKHDYNLILLLFVLNYNVYFDILCRSNFGPRGDMQKEAGKSQIVIFCMPIILLCDIICMYTDEQSIALRTDGRRKQESFNHCAKKTQNYPNKFVVYDREYLLQQVLRY